MEGLIRTIPIDVLITVWSEWTEISDVAITDSAISSKDIRIFFLNMIKDRKFVHQTKFASSNIHYIAWLILRGLRVKLLDFSCKSSVLELPQFSRYFEGLKSLDSLRMDDADLHRFFSKEDIDCDIKSLHILGGKSFSFDTLYMTISKSLKLCNLTVLNMSHFIEFTDTSVALLIKYCPNLTDLDIHCGSVSLQGITALIESYSKRLIRLALHPSDNMNKSHANILVKNIARRCPNLTHLNLTEWYKLNDDGVKYLAQSCGQLRYFNATYCFSLTSAAFQSLIEKNANLTNFNVGDSEIIDSILIALGNLCPQLQVVRCGESYDLTDTAFIHMVTRCPLLHTLYIDGSRLSDVAVLALIDCCPLLSSVYGSFECTEPCIITMIDRCKHLTELVTQLSIAGSLKALENSNKLIFESGDGMPDEHLHFKRTETRKETTLCKFDMPGFFAHWPTIRSLCPACDTIELYGFHNQFINDIREVVTPRLTSLALRHISFNSPMDFLGEIRKLLECFSRQTTVTKFSVTNCTAVNVALLFSELTVSDITLTHLYMTNVTDFTPDTVKLILSKYPNLKVLELCLSGCGKSGFDNTSGEWLREYREQGIRVIIQENVEVQFKYVARK